MCQMRNTESAGCLYRVTTARQGRLDRVVRRSSSQCKESTHPTQPGMHGSARPASTQPPAPYLLTQRRTRASEIPFQYPAFTHTSTDSAQHIRQLVTSNFREVKALPSEMPSAQSTRTAGECRGTIYAAGPKVRLKSQSHSQRPKVASCW